VDDENIAQSVSGSSTIDVEGRIVAVAGVIGRQVSQTKGATAVIIAVAENSIFRRIVCADRYSLDDRS